MRPVPPRMAIPSSGCVFMTLHSDSVSAPRLSRMDCGIPSLPTSCSRPDRLTTSCWAGLMPSSRPIITQSSETRRSWPSGPVVPNAPLPCVESLTGPSYLESLLLPNDANNALGRPSRKPVSSSRRRQPWLPALAYDSRPVGPQLEQARVHLATVDQVGARLAQRHIDRTVAVIEEEQDRAVAERAPHGLHAGRRLEGRLDSGFGANRQKQAPHRRLIQSRADVVRGARSELVSRDGRSPVDPRAGERSKHLRAGRLDELAPQVAPSLPAVGEHDFQLLAVGQGQPVGDAQTQHVREGRRVTPEVNVLKGIDHSAEEPDHHVAPALHVRGQARGALVPDQEEVWNEYQPVAPQVVLRPREVGNDVGAEERPVVVLELRLLADPDRRAPGCRIPRRGRAAPVPAASPPSTLART